MRVSQVKSGSGIAPRDRRRLISMSWAHLLNDGAANYLPGVLPAILVALGQPVTGWLADRTGDAA